MKDRCIAPPTAELLSEIGVSTSDTREMLTRCVRDSFKGQGKRMAFQEAYDIGSFLWKEGESGSPISTMACLLPRHACVFCANKNLSHPPKQLPSKISHLLVYTSEHLPLAEELDVSSQGKAEETFPGTHPQEATRPHGHTAVFLSLSLSPQTGRTTAAFKSDHTQPE